MECPVPGATTRVRVLDGRRPRLSKRGHAKARSGDPHPLIFQQLSSSRIVYSDNCSLYGRLPRMRLDPLHLGFLPGLIVGDAFVAATSTRLDERFRKRQGT
jgi:hypothetical protein